MADGQYPNGVDCVWLAADRQQYIGAFATGGAGPIPVQLLGSLRIPVEEIEEQIIGLPVVTAARLVVALKRPDDFLDLARRGMFAYDWSDIHRTNSGLIQSYEKISVPENPVRVSELPSEIATLVAGIVLDVSFGGTKKVNVTGLLECRSP